MIPREFTAQVIFFAGALISTMFVVRSSPEGLYRWAKPIWFVTLIALFGVMIPGIGYEMGGSRQWYKVGPITIQPAEFAKVTSILFLAAVLNAWRAWPNKIKRYKTFALWFDNVAIPKLIRFAPAFVLGLGLIMIIFDDLGTGAVIAFVAWVMFTLGGASRKSIVACTIIAAIGCYGLVKMQPYRVERFVTHAQRWDADHLDDAGYQTVQSELGMASGGLIGVGIGAGRTKHVMPAATTDFIPATIAEEFGFVGWLGVMMVIGGLTYRLFWLAQRAPTKFGAMALIGVGSWIGVQSVVNVMMANGTLPPIGIPLPFISSGGSSLIALWLALGVSQAAMQPAMAKAKEEAPNAVRGHRRGHGWSRLPSS
jgi:cell division protein FtsW